MAQFDVFRLKSGMLVVDLQTDLIGIDASRIVAPLREGFALVPPTLREESRDEEDLTLPADRAIAANQFAVGGPELKRMLCAHTVVNTFVRNPPN